MPTINGVINQVSDSPIVINGGKTTTFNGLRPHLYDKWRMNWNGNMFAPPELGSVLYLPGIPGTGSTVFDFSGQGNDGTITGATWVKLPSGLWYNNFDGGDDHVTNTVRLFSAYPFTVTAWMKHDSSNTTNSTLISLTNDGAGNVMYAIGIRDADGFGYILGRNTTPVYLYGAVDLSDVWHKYTGVFVSDTSRFLYIDGAVIGEETTSITYNSTVNNYSIGRLGDLTPGEYVKGGVALVQGIAATLTANQVAIDFNQERSLFGV